MKKLTARLEEWKKKPFLLRIGLIMTGISIFFIFVGIFVTPYDPEAMDASSKLAGISFKHIMGCDNFGRDVFSRVLKGSATTLFIATGTIGIGITGGILIGAFAGYFGGALDELLMRINDAALLFQVFYLHWF